MKINTEELRSAFKVVDYVPASPVLETSQYLRVAVDNGVATLGLTGALWAEAKAFEGPGSKEKWTAYVDRRLVKAFLATATAANVELACRKDAMTMKSGQRLEFALHAPIPGYESWSPKAAFDLTPEQSALLKTAVRYLPSLPGTENVAAVCFGERMAIVTDTLMMMGATGAPVARQLLLPDAVARFMAETPCQAAVDKNGAGAVLPNGWVFQPRSTHLDQYPTARCVEQLALGDKAKALATMSAARLLETLSVAQQFLLDKSEDATLDAAGGQLRVTVELTSGKFQRSVPVVGACSLAEPVRVVVKSLLPWLEHVAQQDPDAQVTYAKLENMSALRWADGKRRSTLLVADV